MKICQKPPRHSKKGVINILGKSQILEVIDFMKVLYPNSKSINNSDTTVEAFRMMLGDYSKKEIKQAISSLCQKSRYVPDLKEIFQELKNQCQTEVLKRNDVSVIFVKYEDERIQFKCTDKEQFDEIISFLKTYPTREEVKKFSEENLKRQTNHYRGEILYSPEILAGIEEYRRKAWMDMKINEHKKYNQRRDKQ